MKRFSAILLLCFLFCNNGIAITVINIGINCDSAQHIQLIHTKALFYKYHHTGYVLADSAAFTDNTFIFQTENKHAFAAKIMLPVLNKEIHLFISPAEDKILLIGDYYDYIANNYLILFSEKNKCYAEYIQYEDELNKQTFKKENILLYNKNLQDLLSKCPGQYIDSLVIRPAIIPVLEETDNDADQFYAEHFLDNFNLANDKLLKLPFLYNRIRKYRALYGKEQKAENWIHQLFQKNISDNIRTLLFNYLLYNYTIENNGDAILAVFDKNKDLSIDSTSQDAAFIYALKKLQPNETIPDISLPSIDGKSEMLSAFIKKHKLSVLFLYSHTCEHCLTIAPQLQQLITTYSSKTIGIYAVDTDPDIEGWKKFIADTKYNFTNVYLTSDKALQVSKQYILLGIPILIIVDKNGKIISRFGSIEKLKQVLNAY